MKKIINKPETFVDDMIDGIIAAHSDKVCLMKNDNRVLLRTNKKEDGKVAIVTAGGSGHLPLFLGYVGHGMLDGCAVGNVFASPSASSMADMIRSCDCGKGVICLYGNYGGDKMNFQMACDEVEFDDIETRQLIAGDDIASSPNETSERRRGVAGIVYAYKIVGAAAERGMSIDEVMRIGEKTLANIRTMGFATSPCVIPEVGKPSFTIADDEIEVGMGIHGEPGIEVRKMMTADKIAKLAVKSILADFGENKPKKVSVMINGLGSTPLEEQYIVYKSVSELLKSENIEVVHPHLGEFATSMEMSGLSVTLIALDDEMQDLLEDVAQTPFYTNYNR